MLFDKINEQVLTAIVKSSKYTACSYGFLRLSSVGDIIYDPSEFTGCHSRIHQAHKPSCVGLVNIIWQKGDNGPKVHKAFLDWMVDPRRCALKNAAANTRVFVSDDKTILITENSRDIHIHELMAYAKLPRVYTENLNNGRALNVMLDAGIDPSFAVFSAQFLRGNDEILIHPSIMHGGIFNSVARASFTDFINQTPRLASNRECYMGVDDIFLSNKGITGNTIIDAIRGIDDIQKTVQYDGKFNYWNKQNASIADVPLPSYMSGQGGQFGSARIEQIKKAADIIIERVKNEKVA